MILFRNDRTRPKMMGNKPNFLRRGEVDSAQPSLSLLVWKSNANGEEIVFGMRYVSACPFWDFATRCLDSRRR